MHPLRVSILQARGPSNPPDNRKHLYSAPAAAGGQVQTALAEKIGTVAADDYDRAMTPRFGPRHEQGLNLIKATDKDKEWKVVVMLVMCSTGIS